MKSHNKTSLSPTACQGRRQVWVESQKTVWSEAKCTVDEIGGQLAFIWGRSSEDSCICDVNEEQRPQQFNCHRQKGFDGHGHEPWPFASSGQLLVCIYEMGLRSRKIKEPGQAPGSWEGSCQHASRGLIGSWCPGDKMGAHCHFRGTLGVQIGICRQRKLEPVCCGSRVWELGEAIGQSLLSPPSVSVCLSISLTLSLGLCFIVSFSLSVDCLCLSISPSWPLSQLLSPPLCISTSLHFFF